VEGYGSIMFFWLGEYVGRRSIKPSAVGKGELKPTQKTTTQDLVHMVERGMVASCVFGWGSMWVGGQLSPAQWGKG